MKKRIVVLVLSLVCVISLFGCNKTQKDNTSGSAENNYTRYDETVTLKVGYFRTADATYDFAPFKELALKLLNVKLEFDWDLNWKDHTEKCQLAAATDSLPDAFVCFNYTLFEQLVKGGKLADLTQTYNNEATEKLKAAYQSYPEKSSPLSCVTFDNKLYAIPSNYFDGTHDMLWIRKDWLDLLDLKTPSTVDDILNTARAFVNGDPDNNGKKDTMGIGFDRWKFSVVNQGNSFDPMWYAMGAFPRIFYTDESGKVYYGSTQPEMKAALAKIASAVSEGIVSPYTTGMSQVSSGKCGMFFGTWFSPNALQTIRDTDPNAEWIAVSAPVNSKGEFVVPSANPIDLASGIIVVNAKYKHPEAVLRVKNLFDDLCEAKPSVMSVYKGDKKNLPNTTANPFAIQTGEKDMLIQHLNENLALVDLTDLSGLTESEIKTREDFIAYDQDPTAMDAKAWSGVYSWKVGVAATKAENLVYKPRAIYNFSTEMNEIFSAVDSNYEYNFFFEVLAGAKTIDAFDTFVSDYNKMVLNDLIPLIEEAIAKK